MEVCLINLNKVEDHEGAFKIMQYSEMECNCVRKITVLKILLFPLAVDPLHFRP